MRTLIVLTGLAVLSACTTYPDKTQTSGDGAI
jgi:hypothetical protein